MFRSKTRDIITPQWEHARLAADIAAAWGNDAFDAPPFPHDSFVLGVAYHDREYGFLDTDSIGEMGDDRWLALKQAHLDWPLDDPVAHLIGLFHVRRLIGYGRHAGVDEMAAAFDAVIDTRLEDTTHTRADFTFADRIVDLCDMIAFDFAFDAAAAGRRMIAPRRDGTDALTEVRYEIEEGGTITLAPWPLRVPSLDGMIYAYDADGYPGRLQPVRLAYTVRG